MSLIVLFTSKKGVIISADKRVIDFYPASKCEKLEEELYNGAIKTDYELKKRAGELGVNITIRDNKITKREASATIKKEWNGRLNMVEIEGVIKKAMENCSIKTASVSKEYDLLVSVEGAEKGRVMELIKEDAEKNRWTVEEVF